MRIDFDAEMRRLDAMSPAERMRELKLSFRSAAAATRLRKARRRPPALSPTKGYRGAHKLFRGGKR